MPRSFGALRQQVLMLSEHHHPRGLIIQRQRHRHRIYNCPRPSSRIPTCRNLHSSFSTGKSSSSKNAKTKKNNNNNNHQSNNTTDNNLEFRRVRLQTPRPREWIIHPHLSPYIHAMHSDETYTRQDILFSLSFLGTGAGRTTDYRGPSCTALRFDGGTYLFDVGEGADYKIRECTTIPMNSIHKVFITHLHGDHILGLPTLLLSMQEAAKTNQPRTVEIYGPVGLYNYLAVTLSLISAELKHLDVHVYELRGGSRRWVHPGTYKNFSEFQHRSLQRKSVPPNQDGTWTLSTAQEYFNDDDSTDTADPFSLMTGRSRGLHIHAAQVSHVPKLQCFGYMIQEPLTQFRKIDRQLAEQAGIRPGKKYSYLKAGLPVMNDDQTRQVHPDEVTQPAIAPRKVALLGDCKGVPLPMAELCRDADVIVHEATLLESSSSSNHSDRGGHSTAAMAGIFADFVRARVLALNHISPTNEMRPRDIVEEAQGVISNKTRVQLTYDQMELVIPRGGFVQGRAEDAAAAHFANRQREQSLSNQAAAEAWLSGKGSSRADSGRENED